MNQLSATLSVSLMIVTLIIGLLVGYYVSPSYQQTMFTKEDMGIGKQDKFTDLRYLNQMATHHQAAILLANQIIDKSFRPEITNLAVEIQTKEPKLIDELYQWKIEWYKDNSRAADPIVANLGPADEKTDLRFLNALISHHEEGIAMTKEIRSKSSRKEILDNADAVEIFLQNSLMVLRSWREEWFGVK